MKLKLTFLVSLFFFVSISVAQANNLPIPVAANESITVTLFFPSGIQKVIEPAVNYKFEYEEHGTMGTLVARKGASSNLTVITKNGSIFSFLLQYDQDVVNFTYVLSADQAIGKMEPMGAHTNSSATGVDKKEESPSKNTPVKAPKNEEASMHGKTKKGDHGQVASNGEQVVKAFRSSSEDKNRPEMGFTEPETEFGNEMGENSLYDTDREGYYDIFCANNYDQEVRLSKAIKAGTGIELQLNNIAGDNNEFYFILQVTNRLTSRFKAEELRFYVRTSSKDKPLHMTPVHVFNHQEYVEAGRTAKMVYVFKKFRLGDNQKIFVVLNERDGLRNTILNMDSRMINSVSETSTSSAR